MRIECFFYLFHNAELGIRKKYVHIILLHESDAVLSADGALQVAYQFEECP